MPLAYCCQVRPSTSWRNSADAMGFPTSRGRTRRSSATPAALRSHRPTTLTVNLSSHRLAHADGDSEGRRRCGFMWHGYLERRRCDFQHACPTVHQANTVCGNLHGAPCGTLRSTGGHVRTCRATAISLFTVRARNEASSAHTATLLLAAGIRAHAPNFWAVLAPGSPRADCR